MKERNVLLQDLGSCYKVLSVDYPAFWPHVGDSVSKSEVKWLEWRGWKVIIQGNP